MGRIGVSYEEVATAAQEAQGKGKSPTVDNIRLIIGSGSKSTIARHLRDWRNQQGIARGSDGAIPSELLGLVKGLWERLRDTVEQKAYDYQCESDDKVKQIQQQFASIQEQHHQLQHNLEHYQTATQQLRQEQSLNLEKQRNDYEQQISQLQQRITSITAEKTSYQAQHEQARQTLENLQASHEELNQRAQEVQIQYHSLSKENSRLAEYYKDQCHEIEIKKQSLIELQIKLAAYEEKITILERSLAKAEDKIQILRDDFSFISQEKANLEGQIKQIQKLIPIKQAEIQ